MSQTVIYNFPATIFSSSNSIHNQLCHVISEADEIRRAIADDEGTERIDEEVADLFHSLETLLRIMQRDLGTEYVEKLFAKIKKKNQARGYYTEKEKRNNQ